MVVSSTSVFGPLAQLEGTWYGQLGRALSPSDPTDTCYTEVLTFTRMFPVGNDLAANQIYAMHYEQQAFDPDGLPLHHEVGEWLWDPDNDVISRICAVPRGQAIMAGGTPVINSDNSVVLQVEAAQGNLDWGILNSPATLKTIPTVSFTSIYSIDSTGSLLVYNDTIVLELTGGTLSYHTTANCLHKATQPTDGSLVSATCPSLSNLCQQ